MATKYYFLGYLLFLSALTPVYSQICDCVSTGNCPVPITDNGTFQGTLDVTVSGANDLSVNPLTSVCFTITHTWIGDLSVSLTSPGGTTYLLMADANNNYGGCGMQEDNIDVCIVLGDTNPIGNGSSDYVCNPGVCPAGICCLTGDYTVACGGVTDPITNALEAPNCDLNDFNIPGQPANGTWTLTVNDVCNMDTGTLDNFSLTFGNGVETCIVCSADGGVLDSAAIISCYGNPDLLLDLPPAYSGMPPDSSEYEYAYIISQNGIILEVDSIADLTNQPAGTYQVYGISYYIGDSTDLNAIIGLDTSVIIGQLASTTAPFCGNLSVNAVNVTIVPVLPVTVVDTMVCEGDCILIGGQTVCASGMVTLTSWLGCDSLVDVTIIPIIPDTVNQSVTVCEGGCVDIGGNSFCAPGPHDVTLVGWQGCDSVIHLTFNEIVVAAVINPANPPSITCTNQTVSLDGSGSAGSIYVWSGPNGFTSDQASVTASVPGIYSLTVSDNTLSPPCTSTATVTVGDGVLPPDLIVAGPPPQICGGDVLDLSTLNIQDQNSTNPTLTFHSGTPALPGNQLGSTQVSPASTTVYYILGTNGNCTDETSVTVTVNNAPSADFSATAAICLGDQATVSYTGSAGPGAVFNWDFNGGNTTGSGAGPYQVSWNSSGTYTVSLEVTENGCTSTSFVQNITVEAPMVPPVISCSVTTSSVEFSWPDVPGATNYLVTVLSGPAGTINGSNAYLVNGLNPGDEVTVEVEAVGAGVCGNSTAQQTCVAMDCPPVTVAIDPVAAICLDANTLPFTLSAVVNGGNGTGTLTWTGSGITDPQTGMFDPSAASAGPNVVTVTYLEDNCSFTDNVTIQVSQRPLASMTVSTPICLDENAQIEFDGSASPGSVYTWDFDGGTTANTGAGPYSVSWTTPGTKTITLTVESPDGCISDPVSQTIDVVEPVDAPVINCSVSTSTVLFTWNDVGAAGYNVTFPSGHAGTQVSATSYEVTGLVPGEQVEIEVEALGNGPCGNVLSSQVCESMDCPTVTLAINTVPDLCIQANSTPVQLSANVSGDTPNGTLTWSGTGITDPVNGWFDPLLAGPGTHSIVLSYQENICFYADTLEVRVYQTPDASFSTAANVCLGTPSQLIFQGIQNPGAIYHWDFGGGTLLSGSGPGPYEIDWPSAGNYTISLEVESAEGCVSETFTADVSVTEPLQAPVISCSATTTTMTFTWNSVPGAGSYDFTVLSGQTGSQSGNSYTLTGLLPGTQVDAQLVVSGQGGCPDVTTPASCTTEDCPDISVDVQEVDDFCLGAAAAVQLTVNITGSNGSGSGSWSGSGITDPVNGSFDPVLAGFGAHLIKYTFIESECSYVDSMIIGVYQQPQADFSVEDVICIEKAANVSFNGVAGFNAVYNWDFDGGVAIPGTGPGPHQVVWSTPGMKNITLTIQQADCISAQFVQQVQVDAALDAPVISCTATTYSVEFSWADVAGATGYTVTMINGPAGVQNTPNSYLIDGLDPDQEVTIQVSATGNTVCQPDIAIYSCQTLACTDYQLAILPVDPICLSDLAVPVTLQIDLDGAPDNGSGVWSGPGVTDAIQGIFDPWVAGEGIHTLQYDYQLDNCHYQAEMSVKVAPPPVADAGPDGEISCWESERIVRLGGDQTSTGLHVVYLWTADFGNFPENDGIPNPQVDQPGIYTLVVTDTELGCSATDEVVVTSIADMPEPVISIEKGGCKEGELASISIDSVMGGLEPFFFSLNGAPFVDAKVFPFLDAGDYELTIIDGAGCENQVPFTIEPFSTTPVDVTLTSNLTGNNMIHEGESVQLFAATELAGSQIDSIVWSNPSLLDCVQCLDPVATPLETTTFTVTLYANGCEASDELKIIVTYLNAVYVPNAFSPNGDGVNDLFRLYPGNQVEQVRSFLVFDRWGDMVYQRRDYDPADPDAGWDGMVGGKLMNAATFVWMAEVAFKDGSVKIFEGDVTLVR